MLVTYREGNLLWDGGFVDEAACEAVERHGGQAVVSGSHPHFYGVITEWADRFTFPERISSATSCRRRPRDQAPISASRASMSRLSTVSGNGLSMAKRSAPFELS